MIENLIQLKQKARTELRENGCVSEEIANRLRNLQKQNIKPMSRKRIKEKLDRIIYTIQSNNLSLKIDEVYTFGSFASGKEECRDLDLILIYDHEDEVKRHNVYDWFCGYITSPKQKMNHLLKRSNSERIEIWYDTSLDNAVKHLRNVSKDDCKLLWKRELVIAGDSKEDK